VAVEVTEQRVDRILKAALVYRKKLRKPAHRFWSSQTWGRGNKRGCRKKSGGGGGENLESALLKKEYAAPLPDGTTPNGGEKKQKKEVNR